MSNETVEVTATPYIGRQATTAVLGVDPGLEMVAIEIKARPRGEETITLSRDDFTLISRKDGQKTQAMHPSQIAGPAALVVASSAPGMGGGVLGSPRGPIWGGIPGTGGGRPRRVGGDEEAITGAAVPGETKTTVENKRDSDNPVMAALRQKELPLTKTSEPASGLLYFILEGKHKLKDLELLYKGAGGTLNLDFQK
jgi:hypothetical protein